MRKRALFIIVAIVLTLTLASPVLAASGDEAADRALNWLKTRQNADGGISDGFSPESGVSTTAEAIIALASAGWDAGVLRLPDGLSPLDFVYQQVKAEQVDGAGTVAKVVLALVASGADPIGFAGHNVIEQLETAFDADTGSYGGSIFDQALVMLALANAGQPVPAEAVNYLLNHQTTDGAWNFLGESAALSGDTNTTALAVQALVATGHKDETGRALAYLQRVQNDDGGWPYQNPSPYGTETDANSTALVVQAIYAVGQTPSDWYVDGTDPMGALLALQNSNGSFSYQASFPGDNVLATMQAIPAAAGVTLAGLRRAPTTAIPGSTTGPAPSTLPAAGSANVQAVNGLVVIGLFLVVIGISMRRGREQAAN